MMNSKQVRVTNSIVSWSTSRGTSSDDLCIMTLGDPGKKVISLGTYFKDYGGHVHILQGQFMPDCY